ncbi:MAG: hypothetical protein EZS28_010897 [Streblomastix strix]|uniref:Homeobox domain-containing protein n=1 Tax=Streblomastix strix TaxID=222440 RepID=A0A5J4WF28_9EUKA|nr:MAG: hypothetical protein EZS28_010897 [Streblomastix strix]
MVRKLTSARTLRNKKQFQSRKRRWVPSDEQRILMRATFAKLGGMISSHDCDILRRRLGTTSERIRNWYANHKHDLIRMLEAMSLAALEIKNAYQSLIENQTTHQQGNDKHKNKILESDRMNFADNQINSPNNEYKESQSLIN